MIQKLIVCICVSGWLQGAMGQTRPAPHQDSVHHFRAVSIPIEIRVVCEDQKYQIGWDLGQLDSADMPRQLQFKGYHFDEGDHARIAYRTQNLDSVNVYHSPYIWVGSPGYYWLEYTDSVKGIRYSSDEVRIELCSRFQLADKFTIGEGKFFRPVYSQNIDHIDLVIFDSQGQEVYTSTNPNFKWDGRNMRSGEACAPGSYFYHCDVYENRDGKMIKKNVTGIIEITH